MEGLAGLRSKEEGTEFLWQGKGDQKIWGIGEFCELALDPVSVCGASALWTGLVIAAVPREPGLLTIGASM